MDYLRFLILLFFLNCAANNSNPPLWELQFWILYGKEIPPKVLWVEDAMRRWNLGMRWVPGQNKANSKHWLTVSKDLKCTEDDVIDYKSNCEKAMLKASISGQLLGLCFIENDREKIIKSTIILNSLLFTLATQDAATDIISHEIGHCMGLIHVMTYDNLMFMYYHGQADREPQKTLLKKIYIDGGEISEQEKITYFETTNGGKLIKHDTLPTRMININSFK